MQIYLGFIRRTEREMIKEIGQVEINYSLCGSGGKKLLLLHGWGCDGSLMQPVADGLADQFTILIPDFPGHGKSGRPPEPWGVPEFAACLKAFLRETHFTPCHVIAHSFGCRIVTWLEAEDPALFEKIIFTGAAGIRPRPSAEAQKRSTQYKKLKSICDKAGKVPFLKPCAEKLKDHLRQKYGSRDYNALDEEMRKTFVKVINQDLTDLYSQFQASTLLIWGDADTETPLWMAEEMEKRIPDAGLVKLPGGSHFAYLEQIRYFNTVAKQFLKEEE